MTASGAMSSPNGAWWAGQWFSASLPSTFFCDSTRASRPSPTVICFGVSLMASRTSFSVNCTTRLVLRQYTPCSTRKSTAARKALSTRPSSRLKNEPSPGCFSSCLLASSVIFLKRLRSQTFSSSLGPFIARSATSSILSTLDILLAQYGVSALFQQEHCPHRPRADVGADGRAVFCDYDLIALDRIPDICQERLHLLPSGAVQDRKHLDSALLSGELGQPHDGPTPCSHLLHRDDLPAR